MYAIQNSSPNDIDTIIELYELATQFQKSKGDVVVWPVFERAMVLEEIHNQRQWKLIIDGKIACVWATTYSDAAIWGEKDCDPAVYIHRIATNPKFRGHGFVSKIVTWATDHAKAMNKRYIRLDTMGENQGLIQVYTRAGFEFLGMHDVADPTVLPPHYAEGQVCLFEREV